MFRSKLILLLSVVLISILGACASNVAPPSQPPIYEKGTAPQLKDGPYAVYEAERIFNAPLEPLRLFIEDGNKIVAAMEETENIKKPVDVVVLSGTWPEEGAVRRLEFSDGHYTLERVLKNEFPTVFRYQVWDFTAASGKHLDYALGQQSWEVLPDGQSKLTWTYKLRPNAGFKRPIVQRFINTDMKPLMENALDVVVEQANDHFAN